MLSKSHGKKSAKDRKAKRTPASGGFPTLTDSYNKSDNLVGLVYADIANGVSRSDVIEKIKLGAYEGMERFFPADRIVLTGNPIRKEIVPCTEEMKQEAMSFYGLDPQKKHIFVVGGSLGSRTLNEAMKKWITEGCPEGEDVEVIWQCGKYYKKSIDSFMAEAEAAGKGGGCLGNIRYSDFIQRMDLAYAAADVVISR